MRDRLGFVARRFVWRFPSGPQENRPVKAPYFHLAIAQATSLRFVIRHFAPFPTNEARPCSLVAACGLRRALRIAAIRSRASCRFNSSKDIVFTQGTIP